MFFQRVTGTRNHTIGGTSQVVVITAQGFGFVPITDYPYSPYGD